MRPGQKPAQATTKPWLVAFSPPVPPVSSSGPTVPSRSTHHGHLVHSALVHLACTVCRLLSHPPLKMRIYQSNLTGSKSLRLAASHAQAHPRFEHSRHCAALSRVVNRKQAIDQRSAASRCNTRLSLSQRSPDLPVSSFGDLPNTSPYLRRYPLPLWCPA